MIIAGNWKMNLNQKEAIKLVNQIKKEIHLLKKAKVIIFPPYLLIPHVHSLIHKLNINLGAQDCTHFENGPFTGQISSRMILDAGCKYVILGHSERRILCNETSDDVSKKFYKAFSMGLNPIICIGENINERKKNVYFSVLEEQIKTSLSRIDSLNINSSKNKIIIAYEPIWAIGTGMVASKDNIMEIHTFVKSLIKNNLKIASDISVIYGGSVNENNSSEIFKIFNVDGVLVGGASLKADKFLQIIKNSF